MAQEVRGAQHVVDILEKAGVKWVFGVPGAKVDQVFDALKDSSIRTIVCRHEQNAAFMAQCVGRLTGRAGVVAVTSGPGTANLSSGLLTATTEQDPVVALCGAVPRTMRLKRTHQFLRAEELLSTVCKTAGEIDSADNVSEAVADAFNMAEVAPRGAVGLVLPADVMAEKTACALPFLPSVPEEGSAPAEAIQRAAALIQKATFPVILAGMRSSAPRAAGAIHALLRQTGIPVVETFQGCGVVPRDMDDHYVGRVGLFHNQPGDVILRHADCVLSIGYDPVEYDASLWNAGKADRILITIDDVPVHVDASYLPTCELKGDIARTIAALTPLIKGCDPSPAAKEVIAHERDVLRQTPAYMKEENKKAPAVQGLDPVAVTLTLQEVVPDEATVISDVGSHGIYMGRYFRSYLPQHLLFSNGQQTLGVALPWAIATSLVRPHTPILSVSGDGGFLFSAQELDTAMRIGASFTHVIFDDGTYDMVAFQQIMKYGRTAGVDLGHPDYAAYARSFGAHGYNVTSLAELKEAVARGMKEEGPTVIVVPVDYRFNEERLASDLIEGALS